MWKAEVEAVLPALATAVAVDWVRLREVWAPTAGMRRGGAGREPGLGALAAAEEVQGRASRRAVSCFLQLLNTANTT